MTDESAPLTVGRLRAVLEAMEQRAREHHHAQVTQNWDRGDTPSALAVLTALGAGLAALSAPRPAAAEAERPWGCAACSRLNAPNTNRCATCHQLRAPAPAPPAAEAHDRFERGIIEAITRCAGFRCAGYMSESDGGHYEHAHGRNFPSCGIGSECRCECGRPFSAHSAASATQPAASPCTAFRCAEPAHNGEHGPEVTLGAAVCAARDHRCVCGRRFGEHEELGCVDERGSSCESVPASEVPTASASAHPSSTQAAAGGEAQGVACLLLREAKNLLHHTRCADDDATKCPACSLEARIDEVLK